MLSVRNLSVTRGRTAILKGIHLEIPAGQSIGLLGPSGAGKSTLARAIAGLEKPTTGIIETTATVQYVLQDSLTAFHPRMTVREIIEEPSLIRRSNPQAESLLDQAGLPLYCLTRRAAQLSGGERQRLLLARAFAMEPQLLILDETFSGLDDDARDILFALVTNRRLTLLLISHDILWLRSVCSHLIVLHQGAIVEQGETARVLASPQHDYTRALTAALQEIA